MVPLSLAHLTVLDVAPPALFDLAAQAGYQQVGIRILPAVPGAIAYPLDRTSVVAWRRALADAGVGVHDVELLPLTPSVQVGDYADTLALAAELGARRLNVTGDDADIVRLAGHFAALCELAAPLGLGIDLEFMRFRLVGSLTLALDVVAHAAQPNGRVLVDLLHLCRSGGTADQLRRAPVERLGSVQLCDAPLRGPDDDAGLAAEAREGRLFPSEGGLPLQSLMDALPRDIAIGVEVPTGTTHPRLTAASRAARACAASRALLQQWRPCR
ncbi:MAG: TIM barrel protein [Pseudomonadota bacterium]